MLARSPWILAFVAVSSFALGSVVRQEPEMPVWTRPTQEHADLAKSVGTYEVSAKFYAAPGQAMPFTGTAKRSMILGGKFLQEVFTCDFGGMPFEGRLLQGYDTVRKEYVSVWVDNWSPYLDVSRGHMKDQILVMAGESPDQGGILRATRSVIEQTGDGQWEMKNYQKDVGQEQLSMEFTYQRKK